MAVVINGSTGITTPGLTNSGSTSTAGMTLSSGSITFPNADTQAVGPLGGTGSNQTWQNVAGSRSAGVTYTNTTGRPIALAVSCFFAQSQSWSITIGGVLISDASRNSNSTTGDIPIAAAIVPAGATYLVTVSGATVAYWTELR